MCEREDEDLEHLFMKCSALYPIQAYIKSILMTCCGVRAENIGQWEWVWLFGLPKKKDGTAIATNTILSFTRYAVLLKGNRALFDNIKTDVIAMFKNMFKAHVKLLFMCKREWCKKHFMEDTTICSIDEEEKLCFSL